MIALIDSLARHSDLTALRTFVDQQQERVDLVKSRDYANHRANKAHIGIEIPRAVEPELRRLSAQLTARIGHLPRGNRTLRRAAERALRKAEKRRAS